MVVFAAPYVDIHTHTTRIKREDVIQIRNIYPDFDFSQLENSLFSVGIHPWYISRYDLGLSLSAMNKIIDEYPNCRALGEIGLDRLKPDFEKQIDFFEAQLNLAVERSLPVIIHCVKAFPEILNILNKAKNMVPVIFHGFNSNLETALQIVRKGYYISIGASIFTHEIKYTEILRNISLDSVFLETDDSQMEIDEMYEKIAATTEIDAATIRSVIFDNYQRIFD